jgi:glycosyltransferase involved in cell wall biosynthesis
VTRYCRRLSEALAAIGVEYTTSDVPLPGASTHFHLANSSRWTIAQALRRDRYAVTLHDVRPRTQALDPLYRAVVYPRVIARSAVTVVHSGYAADLLRRLGGGARRVEVIPHPASRPAWTDRAEALAMLGLPGDRPIAVLPGVIKGAKLVREAVEAFQAVRDDWLLLLAGPVLDRAAARQAEEAGAIVLESPDDARYEQAIAASDLVLCLRDGSVGESNGPLLDALGAGRAVLATPTGSIPEVAAEAAHYVAPTAEAIAHGLRDLSDGRERRARERLARERAGELCWESSAEAHADLFCETFGG